MVQNSVLRQVYVYYDVYVYKRGASMCDFLILHHSNVMCILLPVIMYYQYCIY